MALTKAAALAFIKRWSRFSTEKIPSDHCSGCGYPNELHLTTGQVEKARNNHLDRRTYSYRPGTDCYLRRGDVAVYELTLAEAQQAPAPEPEAVAGGEA